MEAIRMPVPCDQNVHLKSEFEANKAATASSRKQPLSAKKAIEFLLNGTLSDKVCRCCLNVTSQLRDLDMVLHLGGQTALYDITIKDMIAHFYPFQVTNNPDLPSKICESCLNQTLRAYLFTQQCERAERALRNYLEDVSEGVKKLDPLECKSKRGRHKINHDKIFVAHETVIDYAEPIMHLVNQGSTLIKSEDVVKANNLSCAKCWQVLPNVESLLNHEKIHPKSMWYHCHQCGGSFAKPLHLKRHIKSVHCDIDNSSILIPENQKFECKVCGDTLDSLQNYLQHIEKHKFKRVLKHALMEKIDELCTVCLEKAPKMVDLETRMAFNGSCAELNGDKSLYHIVGSTIPDMNYFFSYTGTKLCRKCLDRAISTYLFVNQTVHTRRRLDTCMRAMIKTIEEYRSNRTQIEESNSSNMFIELSETLIVPFTDVELNIEDLLDDDIDESQLKVEVLEDQYRIESSGESDEESEKPVNLENVKIEPIHDGHSTGMIDPKTNTGVAANDMKLLQNGLRLCDNSFENVREFLMFKKEEPKKVAKKFEHRCNLCSKSFISVYFLKKHILRHINTKVQCKVCKSCFNSIFLLWEHRKVVHLQGETNYNTCKCGRTFTDMSKMKKHQNSHLKLQCTLCNKQFITQKCYNIHIHRHIASYTLTKRKSLQTCSFCESEFWSRNKLSVHVNKVHLQIKPYPCDMCDRKFYTAYNLENHKRLHSMRSIEKCEFCGAISKCRRDLVIHIRKHMGVKTYSCILCPETFYSKREKSAHLIETHGGRFICNICKAVFAQRSELKLHKAKIHISQF